MIPAAHPTSDSHALLRVWERSAGWTAMTDETLMLCATEPGELAGALSQRNAALLGLHEQLFGSGLELLSRCPHCDRAVEFACDCMAMRRQIAPADAAARHRMQVGEWGVEFRVPTAADVNHAAEGAAADFVTRMIERCVLACTRGSRPTPPSEAPAPVLAALSDQLTQLDPGASLSFVLTCPDCDSTWEAPFDPAQLLWQKLRAAAEQLLLDIDTLARVYGWREEDILRLSSFRRVTYVQLAMS